MKKTFLSVALILSFSLLTACGDIDETGSSVASSTAFETAITTNTTAEETTTEAVTTMSAATPIETDNEPESDTSSITEESTSDTTTETSEVSNADFVSISGDWYIDGDPTLAHIHIEPDGTFQTYYASGNLENKGTIRYESEEIEGTIVNWYCLYSNENEFIMGFVDDGSEIKTDIYIGNGAVPHYTKLSATDDSAE